MLLSEKHLERYNSDEQQKPTEKKHSPDQKNRRSPSYINNIYSPLGHHNIPLDLLSHKLQMMVANEGLPESYYKEFRAVVLKKMKGENINMHKERIRAAFVSEILKLQSESSHGQLIQTILQEREENLKELKYWLSKSKASGLEKSSSPLEHSKVKKQSGNTINLSYVGENLISLRNASLKIIEVVADWKHSIGSKGQDLFSQEVIEKISKDIEFLRSTPLRKYLELSSSNDPLLLYSLKKFWKLELSSNFNFKPIIEFFEVSESYQIRLMNAEKFTKTFKPSAVMKYLYESKNLDYEESCNKRKAKIIEESKSSSTSPFNALENSLYYEQSISPVSFLEQSYHQEEYDSKNDSSNVNDSRYYNANVIGMDKEKRENKEPTKEQTTKEPTRQPTREQPIEKKKKYSEPSSRPTRQLFPEEQQEQKSYQLPLQQQFRSIELPSIRTANQNKLEYNNQDRGQNPQYDKEQSQQPPERSSYPENQHQHPQHIEAPTQAPIKEIGVGTPRKILMSEIQARKKEILMNRRLAQRGEQPQQLPEPQMLSHYQSQHSAYDSSISTQPKNPNDIGRIRKVSESTGNGKGGKLSNSYHVSPSSNITLVNGGIVGNSESSIFESEKYRCRRIASEKPPSYSDGKPSNKYLGFGKGLKGLGGKTMEEPIGMNSNPSVNANKYIHPLQEEVETNKMEAFKADNKKTVKNKDQKLYFAKDKKQNHQNKKRRLIPIEMSKSIPNNGNKGLNTTNLKSFQTENSEYEGDVEFSEEEKLPGKLQTNESNGKFKQKKKHSISSQKIEVGNGEGAERLHTIHAQPQGLSMPFQVEDYRPVLLNHRSKSPTTERENGKIRDMSMFNKASATGNRKTPTPKKYNTSEFISPPGVDNSNSRQPPSEYQAHPQPPYFAQKRTSAPSPPPHPASHQRQHSKSPSPIDSKNPRPNPDSYSPRLRTHRSNSIDSVPSKDEVKKVEYSDKEGIRVSRYKDSPSEGENSEENEGREHQQKQYPSPRQEKYLEQPLYQQKGEKNAQPPQPQSHEQKAPSSQYQSQPKNIPPSHPYHQRHPSTSSVGPTSSRRGGSDCNNKKRTMFYQQQESDKNNRASDAINSSENEQSQTQAQAHYQKELKPQYQSQPQPNLQQPAEEKEYKQQQQQNNNYAAELNVIKNTAEFGGSDNNGNSVEMQTKIPPTPHSKVLYGGEKGELPVTNNNPKPNSKIDSTLPIESTAKQQSKPPLYRSASQKLSEPQQVQESSEKQPPQSRRYSQSPQSPKNKSPKSNSNESPHNQKQRSFPLIPPNPQVSERKASNSNIKEPQPQPQPPSRHSSVQNFKQPLQRQESTASLKASSVVSNASGLTTNLTKCIFQSKSLETEELAEFLLDFNIPQSQIEEVTKQSQYFSHRHLCLNLCWFDNEVISFTIYHPTFINSDRYVVIVMFKVVSSKYQRVEYANKLVMNIIKYIFFNDPCERILFMLYKKEEGLDDGLLVDGKLRLEERREVDEEEKLEQEKKLEHLEIEKLEESIKKGLLGLKNCEGLVEHKINDSKKNTSSTRSSKNSSTLDSAAKLKNKSLNLEKYINPIQTAFEDKAVLLNRMSLPCRNDEEYINVIEMEINIMGHTNCEFQSKIGRLEISEQYRNYLNTLYLDQRIEIKGTKETDSEIKERHASRFENAKDVKEYLDAEQITAFEPEHIKEMKVCLKQPLLVYNKMMFNFTRGQKFSVHCELFYFLIESPYSWYWETEDIGYLVIKAESTVGIPLHINEEKNIHKPTEFYFIFADYTYETDQSINSQKEIHQYMIGKDKEEFLKENSGEVEGKIITVPSFESNLLMKSPENTSSKYIANTNFNLSWKHYLKGVRSINDEHIESEYIAPFYMGLLYIDSQNKIQLLTGMEIQKDEEKGDEEDGGEQEQQQQKSNQAASSSRQVSSHK